jgi:hypothetical protein
LYFVACGLLAAAGGIKVFRAHDSALALVRLWPAVGLRRAALSVRLLAGLEAVLGVVGIVYPSAVGAGLVAASYVGFVAVVSYVRARGGPLATCGCFGTPDTPPTLTHALIDAVLAAGAALYAAAGTGGWLVTVLRHQYFRGVPLLCAAVLCGWLAFLAMVWLPRLQALQPEGAVQPGGAAR